MPRLSMRRTCISWLQRTRTTFGLDFAVRSLRASHELGVSLARDVELRRVACPLAFRYAHDGLTLMMFEPHGAFKSWLLPRPNDWTYSSMTFGTAFFRNDNGLRLYQTVQQETEEDPALLIRVRDVWRALVLSQWIRCRLGSRMNND